MKSYGKTFVTAAALTAGALTAGADTSVYALKESASNGGEALKTKTDWAEVTTGVAPAYTLNDDGSVGMEFLVDNGRVLRTINALVNLRGHLTIGTTDTPGYVRNKHYDSAITYHGGIMAVNGGYEATGSGSGSEEHNLARIDGPITIASPASKPFAFALAINPAEKQSAGVWLYSNLTGADGTGIVIGDVGQSKYKSGSILQGDNSAYLGSIHFATAGIEYTNTVASATALGGAPTETVADAVKVTTKGRATLLFTSAVGSTRIPATRGVYFNGVEGGTTYPRTFDLAVQEGADVEICGPLYANGQCSGGRNELTIAKTGAGTLTLSGDVTIDPGVNRSQFNVVADEGRLVLGSETARALKTTLNEHVWYRSATTPVNLTGVTFDTGAGLVIRQADAATGTFVLDATCSIATTPIAIKLQSETDGYAAIEACVLEVPTTVKALTAADFVDADGEGLGTVFRIDTEGDVQRVYLTRAANNTIAHLTFDSALANTARVGVLDDPKVTVNAPLITTEGVFSPRVTVQGDSATTLRTNLGFLDYNRSVVEYCNVGDLMRFDAQTIEFYVKAVPQLRWQGLMALKNNTTAYGIAWYVLFDNGVANLAANEKIKVTLCLEQEDGTIKSGQAPVTPTPIADGKWHHFAYTFARNAEDDWKTDLKMYIDHKLVGSTTATGRVQLHDSDTARFYLGADDRNQRFNGCIDELRISRGALTPDQFLRLRQPRGLMVIVH